MMHRKTRSANKHYIKIISNNNNNKNYKSNKEINSLFMTIKNRKNVVKKKNSMIMIIKKQAKLNKELKKVYLKNFPMKSLQKKLKSRKVKLKLLSKVKTINLHVQQLD